MTAPLSTYPRPLKVHVAQAAMNEPRRLDERALCFDPDPSYRREIRERIEKEASDAQSF